ncbi:MAG: serine/threonine-protein kinase, partial [Acidobacteriota bacterium]
MDDQAAFDARVDEIFDRLLDLEPAERGAALDASCGDDRALREAVERLLAYADKPPVALGTSALVAAPWVDAEDETRGADGLDGRAAPAAEVPPGRVGPYRILDELGRGGMGVVFLAERDDGHFSQRVALKVMRPGTESPEMRRRFEQERQIIAELNHPNIARLYDGGVTDDGRPYSAMELVEGVPITEFCDRRRLGVRERLALFEKVGRAVHYAHQNLVVHRDLKPSNILVTEDGDLKLLDFGIAKLLDLSDIETCDVAGGMTRTGRIPMTPLYASPEQLKGNSVTTASDVYQLGLLLFEIVTGERARDETSLTPSAGSSPFGFEETPLPAPSSAVRKAPDDRREASSRLRATTPKGLRKQLHGDLDTIVLAAAHPESGRRYPSAAELVEDLKRYRDGFPLSARRDSLAYRARRFARRHRLGVAVAALFLALLVGYAATVTVQAERIAAERDRAERVLSYALGLYGAGDPNEALGREISAESLVDRGVERLDAELADEPHVQAELLAHLGRIYQRLGRMDKAETTLRRALELNVELHGREHGDAVDTLSALGRVLVSRRDPGAQPVLEEALELRRRLHGDDHKDTATVRRYLGVHLSTVGRYVDAEAHLRAALDVHRRLVPRSLEVAADLSDLGLAVKRQGRIDEAIELQREALALDIELFGELHPETASTYNNLADTLWKAGELDAGDEAMVRSLELMAELYGDAHRNIATSLGNFGTSMMRRGDLEQSADYFRRSLEMRRTLAGGEDRYVAQSSAQLGEVLHRLGRLDESEASLLDALRIFGALSSDTPGGAPHDQVQVWRRLAPVWLDQGRYADAERILRRALPIFREYQR